MLRKLFYIKKNTTKVSRKVFFSRLILMRNNKCEIRPEDFIQVYIVERIQRHTCRSLSPQPFHPS